MVINIPKTLKVGYNNRSDTYSGKLAYVVYLKKKNKAGDMEIAKEASWRGWIKPELGVDEFDNAPTEGFVLNKKVGDYHYSWYEGRRAKIRVYDPRGFEVEITPENLLWVLECCSSIKGKGLEGEFVYGWDGADLLLVPCCSADYIESTKLMEKREKKNVKAADLVVGNKYILAYNGSTITYIGKRRRYEEHHLYHKCDLSDEKYDTSYRTPVERDRRCYCKDCGNAWWFLDKDDKLIYIMSVPNRVLDDNLGQAEPSVLEKGLELLNASLDAKCRDYVNDRLEPMTYEEFCDKLPKRSNWGSTNPFYTIVDMNCDYYLVDPHVDDDGKKTFTVHRRNWGWTWRDSTIDSTLCMTTKELYDYLHPAWRCFAYTDGTIIKTV